MKLFEILLLTKLILGQSKTDDKGLGGNDGVYPPSYSQYDTSPPIISSGDTEGLPIAKKSYFTYVEFKDEQNIPLMVFKVDFDRNIFIASDDGLKPMSDPSWYKHNAETELPILSDIGIEMFKVTCDGLDLGVQAPESISQGPPPVFLLA